MTIHDLQTPAILIDVDRLDRNLRRMQDACNAGDIELWPHIKTHKCVEILKRQLALGAKGMTCAKLGEAEALLPSGVKQVFLAHSLVDPKVAPRLRALAEQLDRLILATTSAAHCEHLARVVAGTGLDRVPVLAALDTGLGREGARSLEAFLDLVAAVDRTPNLEFIGIYTHEGHCYGTTPETLDGTVDAVYERLMEASRALGREHLLAPGCSASALRLATKPGLSILRPGAYPLGDLTLGWKLKLMPWDDIAITVLATVVDRPENGLALIDAGSKVFSGDKSKEGHSGRDWNAQDRVVAKVNEEHGYVQGGEVDTLRIGDRRRFVPNHVCTVMNLTDEVFAVRGENVLETWKIEARGKVR